MVGIAFLQYVSYINQSEPTKKYLLRDKKWPNATFNLIFLWLGWPWVGEFVGFIIIFACFSNSTEFGTRYIANTLVWTVNHCVLMKR